MQLWSSLSRYRDQSLLRPAVSVAQFRECHSLKLSLKCQKLKIPISRDFLVLVPGFGTKKFSRDPGLKTLPAYSHSIILIQLLNNFFEEIEIFSVEHPS